MRRVFLAALAALAAAATLAAGGAGPAVAAWPERPIRFVVPYPAGGPTDVLARTIGERLSARYGQQVVVDNRPGAGGNLGADQVAKAAPDGHTLVLGTNSTHASNAGLYPNMPYDTARDFAPVTLVATVTNVLVVNPSVPARTVEELVAHAKANPGKLNYASSGSGSAAHLTGELFKMAAGIDMVHVPYRGAPPALTDLVAGQVQAMFATLPSALPQIQADRLRALAVTGRTPAPALPNVPTMAATLPGFESDAWFGVFAPAGTPSSVIDRLAADVAAVVAEPEVAQKLRAAGFEPATLAPAELRTFQAAEMEKWAAVVRASGATPE
ncbi:MAG TPA: tripartite tricarboxylate transporter substrate binding protein [Azospirillaceae bacterium]|nr:tripartite tricarboxylate transporter substrate binding protein [Azospirillaceae bacterium]